LLIGQDRGSLPQACQPIMKGFMKKDRALNCP
jgi:hypothetical protein